MPIAPPPPVICSSRVLAYAIIPADVPFTDRAIAFVGDNRLGRVPCVAIGETLQASGGDLLLLYCDEEWGLVALGGGDMAAIKRRMELNYPGVSAHWVDVNTPVDVALKYHDEYIDPWHCSTCGKRAFDVDTMVDHGATALCGTCLVTTPEGAVFKAILDR